VTEESIVERGSRRGPTRRKRRALVVGGGVFGLTGALELRRRGWRVTLLDAGHLPAAEASSTAASRMVRMDYGADTLLTELAAVALAGWDAWNTQWREPLYHDVGILLMRSDPPRPGGFEFESRAMLASRGHLVETVDVALMAHRFPMWKATRWAYGYFNPRGGWVEATKVVRELARAARRARVRIREGVKVVGLAEEGSRVTGVLDADGRTHRADAVVVAAGAWSTGILPWLQGALQTVAQPVLHLQVDEPERWRPPAFVPWAADVAETGWYGFPADADGLVTVGHHGSGVPGDPDGEAPVPEEHVDRCRSFLSEAIPELAHAPVVVRRSCLYCDTFDGYFWIGRDPDRRGLVVATGGSGHAFKFAPVLGPLVADAVEGDTSRFTEPFRWRPFRGAVRTEAARSTAR
jgi:glycine/D-amino acid oxidase-like deaminating enzyme